MNNLVSDVGPSRIIVKPRMNKYSGVAIIEFTLVMSLLLAIMFGIIEYGFIIYDKILITNASREVARAGIKGVTISSTYWTDPDAGIYLIGFPQGTPPPLEYTIVSDPAGDLVRGEVTYTYHGLYTSVLLGPSVTITASTVMRK